MRKRILSALLASMMVISLAAGCGKENEKDVQIEDTQAGISTEEASESDAEILVVEHGRSAPSNGGPIVSDYVVELPQTVVDTDIFVEKIEGISDDFIKGMDISSILSQEESGVKYYNEDGTETDLFQILADAGINYIRVRVWNDPYDKDGNGYGGGNCDAATAAIIGARAAKYGMKLSVDFHYSDFWADPSKQMVPKAWADMDLETKKQAVHDYTVESLNTIIDAGANVGMVQIGNEINTGMAGEKKFENIAAMLVEGSAAVREVAAKWNQDIEVAVHYTNIDNPTNIIQIAGQLQDLGVDYDIFGVSYYSYWHGTMENLTNVLSSITEKYGVKTCVMETSYMYTGDDGDSSGNSASEADAIEGYPCSVQGQVNNIRDVMAAAVAGGAIGVFYWEGAWTPVGSDFASNQKLWEQYGSGWASSYASEYDPKDAGQYYGGSSWDNQAFFDHSGKVLPSLNVFKYVNHGAVGPELEIMAVSDVELEFGVGEELCIPETVQAYYNDSSYKEQAVVSWDDNQLAAVDMNTAATYTVNGTTADGTSVTATIKVSSINFLENPGFEEADTSMWVVSEAAAGTTDIQNKASDAHSGENSFHFWSESEVSFTVEQTLTELPQGNYGATVCMQGGDVGSDAKFVLYVKVGDKVYESETVMLTGWVDWKTPVINGIEVDGNEDVVVGVSAKCAAKGWGTIDDFEFYPEH